MACSETFYINSSTSLQEKIQRYDAVILALENQMVNVAAGNSDIDEYQLEDGQVKIRTKYRDVNQIAQAIKAFESLRTRCINELNGYGFVLRDRRSME